MTDDDDVIAIDTATLVMREQPVAAKVARFQAMLRTGSCPPPIAIIPLAPAYNSEPLVMHTIFLLVPQFTRGFLPALGRPWPFNPGRLSAATINFRFCNWSSQIAAK